jgi:DNA helicase-2/ATP-dependent DNA helicase PcrA
LHFESTGRPGGGRSLNQPRKYEEPTFRGGLSTRNIAKPNLRSINDLPKANQNQNSSSEFMVGDNVLHESFGKGKITKIDGIGGDKKATIFFPLKGTKVVILRFANLKKIDE